MASGNSDYQLYLNNYICL